MMNHFGSDTQSGASTNDPQQQQMHLTINMGSIGQQQQQQTSFHHHNYHPNDTTMEEQQHHDTFDSSQTNSQPAVVVHHNNNDSTFGYYYDSNDVDASAAAPIQMTPELNQSYQVVDWNKLEFPISSDELIVPQDGGQSVQVSVVQPQQQWYQIDSTASSLSNQQTIVSGGNGTIKISGEIYSHQQPPSTATAPNQSFNQFNQTTTPVALSPIVIDSNQFNQCQSMTNTSVSGHQSIPLINNNNNNNVTTTPTISETKPKKSTKRNHKSSGANGPNSKSSSSEGGGKQSKPVSAYALFFRDTQSTIKTENPSASFGEISKIVASKWELLRKEDKDVYKERADLEKRNYLQNLASTKAKEIATSSTNCNINNTNELVSSEINSKNQPSSSNQQQHLNYNMMTSNTNTVDPIHNNNNSSTGIATTTNDMSFDLQQQTDNGMHNLLQQQQHHHQINNNSNSNSNSSGVVVDGNDIVVVESAMNELNSFNTEPSTTATRLFVDYSHHPQQPQHDHHQSNHLHHHHNQYHSSLNPVMSQTSAYDDPTISAHSQFDCDEKIISTSPSTSPSQVFSSFNDEPTSFYDPVTDGMIDLGIDLNDFDTMNMLNEDLYPTNTNDDSVFDTNDFLNPSTSQNQHQQHILDNHNQTTADQQHFLHSTTTTTNDFNNTDDSSIIYHHHHHQLTDEELRLADHNYVQVNNLNDDNYLPDSNFSIAETESHHNNNHQQQINSTSMANNNDNNDNYLVNGQQSMNHNNNHINNVSTCARSGCQKQPIDSTEWDSEFCSEECCVRYCAEIFRTWTTNKLSTKSDSTTTSSSILTSSSSS